jgi:hypothetical protein
MVRPAFDTTLADLADISVSVNRTTSQATETQPCIATVTIPAHLLQQILTCASLHMSDNPFVPRPEIGDLAEVIASNNAVDQDWHWEMRDTIEILSARCSVAQSPDYPQNGLNKERSVASDRQFRALKKGWDEKAKVEAEAIDSSTPEGMKARWDALNVKPLRDKQIVGLMATLLEGEKPQGFAWNIVAPLFENYRKEAAKAAKGAEAISAARKLLGGT